MIVTLTSEVDAQALDRLVSRFAEELADYSEDCVFYLSAPGHAAPARIVEAEQRETLRQFIAFVSPHLQARFA